MASRHVFDESVFPYKTSPTSTATQPSSHTLLIFDTWIPCSDFNSVAGNTVTAPVPPCLSPLPTFTIPTLALQASDATLSQDSRHNLQPVSSTGWGRAVSWRRSTLTRRRSTLTRKLWVFWKFAARTLWICCSNWKFKGTLCCSN
jgi:hypothetical protein